MEKLLEEARKYYRESQIAPGGGNRHSLQHSHRRAREPQMTMRTHHMAGVSELNVTVGLPRIIEILDARKEPQASTVNAMFYLKSQHTAKAARNLTAWRRAHKAGSHQGACKGSFPEARNAVHRGLCLTKMN